MSRPAPVLSVQSLCTWFPIQKGLFSRTVGYIRAVDGVSLTLKKGETLGLVGESGCGKTTLGRTIMGLEHPIRGKVIFLGKELFKQRKSERHSKKLQMIFQDPYSSLNPRMTILEIVTEGMVHHRMIKKQDQEKEAKRLLSEVGLDHHAIYRYPHEFSGGQRQRISIARALSLKPECIVCDEPVSALDVSVQAQVLHLFLDLQRRYSISYLFISHDISVVRYVSDRIAVMYLGHIVEEGMSHDIIENPLHPYTQALLEAVPTVGKKRQKPSTGLIGEIPSPANPPSGCVFHPRCPKAMPLCATQVPKPKTLAGRTVQCHLIKSE